MERSTMLWKWEHRNYFDWAMFKSSQTLNVYRWYQVSLVISGQIGEKSWWISSEKTGVFPKLRPRFVGSEPPETNRNITGPLGARLGGDFEALFWSFSVMFCFRRPFTADDSVNHSWAFRVGVDEVVTYPIRSRKSIKSMALVVDLCLYKLLVMYPIRSHSCHGFSEVKIPRWSKSQHKIPEVIISFERSINPSTISPEHQPPVEFTLPFYFNNWITHQKFYDGLGIFWKLWIQIIQSSKSGDCFFQLEHLCCGIYYSKIKLKKDSERSLIPLKQL